MGDTIITLSKEQWQQLNTQCSIWLQDITTFTGEDAASIVKRLGLVLYRIAMLLTTLRKYENGEASETVECSDVDFNTAFQLVEIYLQHSILMFNNLPRQQENNSFQGGDSKRKFFESLAGRFTRAEAVKQGATYGLSPRTVDEILRNAIPNLLVKIKAGHYEKA